MYVGETLAGTEIRMDVRGLRPAWGLTGVERNEAGGQFRGADGLKVMLALLKVIFGLPLGEYCETTGNLRI